MNQKLDIGYVFSLPDDYQIIFDPNPDAIVIAGVNLERYKSMPDYTLRNPDEFMIALVNQWDKCVETIKKSNFYSYCSNRVLYLIYLPIFY